MRVRFHSIAAPATAVALPLACAAARAADAVPVHAAATPAAGYLQATAGLLVVLAAVVVFGWVMRRYASPRGRDAGALRVVGALAVGQRERVVLVELAGTWLVVGVAPGRVNALHALARPEQAGQPLAPQAQPPFQAWLARFMKRKHHADE
jgi:flagellar protein FliO/FliZ